MTDNSGIGRLHIGSFPRSEQEVTKYLTRESIVRLRDGQRARVLEVFWNEDDACYEVQVIPVEGGPSRYVTIEDVEEVLERA